MSAPSSDQVQQNVDSGQEDPGTPGLNAFSGAWRALQDFTGEWASNNQMQFQAYADLITSYGNWWNSDH